MNDPELSSTSEAKVQSELTDEDDDDEDISYEHLRNLECWSDVRRAMWDDSRRSPNRYFYRYKPPGEDVVYGKWSEAEKKYFIEQLLLKEDLYKD